MNELQIFNNDDFGEIRTVTINNEPYFVGKDIASALGYKDTADAIKRHVDNEDKLTRCFTYSGQSREMYVVNESGMYALILSSKLESAKKFKHWVTSEVLPTIRKTGTYKLPGSYADALRQLAIEVEQKEKLMLENEQMKPKADFFDTVADSKTAISMNEVAKVLDMGIGRNKLFEFLRDKKILMNNNVPYQRYVDYGWFRVIEQSYQKNGEPVVATKTLVYQKGVQAIRQLLSKEVITND